MHRITEAAFSSVPYFLILSTMKVLSTNTARPTRFLWNGKEETTGIFKRPTSEPLYLTKNDVAGDEISNRVNHGGYYKACYIFSAGQYPYWKMRYPQLEWDWGMFGENLTVEGLDEKAMYVGDVYRLGGATVQVSQYREPCYKLGYRFGTQQMIRQFIEHGFGGSYLSVLEEGSVTVGDEFELLERPEVSLTVAELFNLAFSQQKDQELLRVAAACRAIPHKKRMLFQRHLK